MLITRILVLLFTGLMTGLTMAAPIDESDFHSKVATIYNFEPYKLKAQEMEAKSKQLDQFWSLVVADPTNTLPMLRKELEDPSHAAFFFYDGSKLLLSISPDRSDQILALRSISKAGLRGINQTDYLQTIHWFAGNGFDTREAAFRILSLPNFKAFIPQHVLTLDQNYSLIYMLFPMDESLFVDELASRLALESNAQSLKSLLLALWHTATPTGYTAIKNFIDDPNNPADVKAYAKTLLDRNNSSSSSGSVNFSSNQSLREERRKIMQGPISNEALLEFDKLTEKILAKQ